MRHELPTSTGAPGLGHCDGRGRAGHGTVPLGPGGRKKGKREANGSGSGNPSHSGQRTSSQLLHLSHERVESDSTKPHLKKCSVATVTTRGPAGDATQGRPRYRTPIATTPPSDRTLQEEPWWADRRLLRWAHTPLLAPRDRPSSHLAL
jgi:hypothetical protein